jgi:hypothetical protein
MENKPIAIIDVDNTLHPFHIPLHEELRKLNPKIPHWSEWQWNFYENYVTKKTFQKVVNKLHSQQEFMVPYPEARQFLDVLYKKFYIIIASHRLPEHKIHLVNWLDMWRLKYDEVYCGPNKTKLPLFMSASLVVDDSPEIIVTCIENNIQYAGLKFPWNKKWSKVVDNLLELHIFSPY